MSATLAPSQKERTAGIVALALGGLVALVTIVHLVQVIVIIASGRVQPTTIQFSDNVLIVSQQIAQAEPATGVPLAVVVAAIITDVTILGVVSLVLAIGLALVRGRPFGPRMPTAVATTGIAIAIGGTLGSAANSYVDSHTGGILGPLRGGSLPDPFLVPFGPLSFSLLPLAAGLTIVLLAFVFRSGARIQHDTDGLV